jgi:hypothetical protein
MVYVHPILGAVSVLLACWLAIHGLRSRHPAPYAPESRRLHRTVAPWMLGLWVATWSAGLASTAFLREDLPAARSVHFAVACTGVALFGAGWLLSRRFATAPWGRRVHPWLGLAGVACALALAVLGMRLLP